MNREVSNITGYFPIFYADNGKKGKYGLRNK